MKTNNFTIDEVRDFWESVSDIYDDINEKIKETHHQRFLEACKYLELKPEFKILNLWSRTGKAIPYLRKQEPKIDLYNLELTPAFIDIAKKRFPNEKFSTTDLNILPYENEYFDCILSLETLEHTPNPQNLINEFYRVLKTKGKLVMSLPPRTSELSLKIYEIFFDNHGEGPHRFIPSSEVKEGLANTGFKLVLHKGTLLIPAGPSWLQKIGEDIINSLQNTPIRELGIRQFYVCEK